MNRPQPQPLSHCVSENAVPAAYGDTWGQFDDKAFLSLQISMQCLNSRARVGTSRTRVSPPVPTLMGTGAFKCRPASGLLSRCTRIAIFAGQASRIANTEA